jgi:N-acetylglucosamine kinase-like BadF-type ATPase
MQELHAFMPRDVIRVVYGSGFDRGQMASLCPLVGNSASRGEADALQILDNAAEALCYLARSVQERMSLSSGPVGLTGGVTRMGKWIMDPFISKLQKYCPSLSCTPQRYSPVVGGMLHLMAECGHGDWELGEAMEKELKEKYTYADGPVL